MRARAPLLHHSAIRGAILHLPEMKPRLRFDSAVSSKIMYFDGAMLLLSFPFLAIYQTFYFYSLSPPVLDAVLLLVLCRAYNLFVRMSGREGI
ncbi:hypothetical protein SDJN03_05628, partial [Cucurbita argyrosperma subsp. sororia]